MEEERIAAVLARATELRLKISNCIVKASTSTTETVLHDETLVKNENGVEDDPGMRLPNHEAEVGEAEDEEEAERLLDVCNALESLETQLASLQALQQQQQYQREVALAEIEHSREVLLHRLKQYRGDELGVIQEACAFAGETVEHNNDLVLPPYPSRPPHSHLLDKSYLQHSASSRKSFNSGMISSHSTDEAKKNVNGAETRDTVTGSKNPRNGMGAIMRTVAVLFGVVSVLSLSGFGPGFSKRGIPLNVSSVFRRRRQNEEGVSNIQCPPGKILVMEDGEARCLVKERIEVPFSSVVSKPDVNFGCG